MAEQYTYAVSRIRAMEPELLSRPELEQLLAAPDVVQAMQQLADKGFGGGEVFATFEELLEAERDRMWETLYELVPEDEVFTVFRYETDFHNLKAAVKAVVTDMDTQGLYQDNGTVPAEQIAQAVQKREYDALPEHLRQTAQQAVDVLLQTRSGQECDIVIDRAALEQMKEAGQSSDVELVRDYMEWSVALADIKIAVRGCRTGKPAAFLRRAMVSCRTLDTTKLAAAAAKNMDAVMEYLAYTRYAAAVEALKESMSAFEKWADNQIMALVRAQKTNPFTIAPVLAFMLAKENERKTVRMILTGKQNGIAEEAIRERLRDSYV